LNRTQKDRIESSFKSKKKIGVNIKFNIDPDFLFDLKGFECGPFGCHSTGRGIVIFLEKKPIHARGASPSSSILDGYCSEFCFQVAI
jgi:hypothetical protein